jgi:hypothetical protein
VHYEIVKGAMQELHIAYGLNFPKTCTHWRCGNDAVPNERTTMSTQVSFKAVKQADVDRYIAQAHRMRGEYMAHLFRVGFARVRALFPQGKRISNAPA